MSHLLLKLCDARLCVYCLLLTCITIVSLGMQWRESLGMASHMHVV